MTTTSGAIITRHPTALMAPKAVEADGAILESGQPGGIVTTEICRIAVSRTVRAQPSKIFRMVCDPNMQVKIDGSGMLQAAPGAQPMTAVGDTFEMEMDREPLGDLPMGKYKALNTVTKIVPDALLEWSVGNKDRPSFGHVYGWEMTRLIANTPR